MRASDPLLFLFGHRGAIERIAATGHAWIVGAILVLSAGIARNYDHLDLLREPEWFIGPFAASLVSIVFIFLCIKGPLKLALVGREGQQLHTFLTFAWMTAPCAWLYGIPVETMTDIITATKWNVAFLAIVSLWRVALMTRAVAVLTGVKHLRAFVLVLAPAAFEAMIGSAWKGMSLVQIMGGIRLPPHTELLREASGFVSGASFWIFVASVIACWIVKGTAARPLQRDESDALRPALVSAVVSLIIWIGIALPFQPKVGNKHRLEVLLKSRDYDAAIAFASSKTRDDFPRIHHFPPDPWKHFPLELLDAIPHDAPAWLKEEWQNGAVESFAARLWGRRIDWKKFGGDHPEVARAVDAYAELVRANTNRSRADQDWLRDYERLTQPREAADPNPRFDSKQVPPLAR